MNRTGMLVVLALLTCACVAPARSTDSSGFGVRGGVGTDIKGGLAYGVGVNYLPLRDAGGCWEFGAVLYGGSYKETTEEYFTYEDKTTVAVYGVLVNRLIHYQPLKHGGYGIAGLGAGAASMTWEERSNGDTTLGTRLANGGSMQSLSGTKGGLIVNVGAGWGTGGAVDLRLEAPILFISQPPGNASSVVPALTATLGMRF